MAKPVSLSGYSLGWWRCIFPHWLRWFDGENLLLLAFRRLDSMGKEVTF